MYLIPANVVYTYGSRESQFVVIIASPGRTETKVQNCLHGLIADGTGINVAVCPN